MAQGVLKANDRKLGLSKGELNKERKIGNIPAIFFGKGMESVPLFVNGTEFDHVFKDNGKIFEIEVGGKKHLINTKFIHKDPLRKITYQIDFYKLTKGVKTSVKVPVELTGEAKGQKEGGSVSLIRKVLEIEGTPMNIPEKIEIDISALEIGDSLHISELNTGGKYEFLDDGELTVATCVAPQKEEEPEATEEEALAGGEETPAEGAPEASADSEESKEEDKKE